jgi:hypothetical protein
MPTSIKSASQIFIRVGVRKFDGLNLIEEWDTSGGPPLSLADKISEYLMRIGDSNSLCLNIVIQLLTDGKVRVDFRDTTERILLLNSLDIMSRVEAVTVFDRWIQENRDSQDGIEQTQKIIMHPPPAKPPVAS